MKYPVNSCRFPIGSGAQTYYMPIQKVGKLVQYEAMHVHFPKPLLQGTAAMGYNMQHLLHKALICGNSAVPALYKLSENDGQKGVQL